MYLTQRSDTATKAHGDSSQMRAQIKFGVLTKVPSRKRNHNKSAYQAGFQDSGTASRVNTDPSSKWEFGRYLAVARLKRTTVTDLFTVAISCGMPLPTEPHR